MRIERLKWQDTLFIRQAVLWPSKPIEFCHVEDDESAWHYGVYIDQALVCIASVYPESENEDPIKRARLRKFATLDSHQKQGIGSFMLDHIIDTLKSESIDIFWCDARESAIEFYKRFGFQKIGNRFYKSDIPYFKMEMKIN